MQVAVLRTVLSINFLNVSMVVQTLNSELQSLLHKGLPTWERLVACIKRGYASKEDAINEGLVCTVHTMERFGEGCHKCLDLCHKTRHL